MLAQKNPFAGYSREHRPLGGYGVIVGTFNLLFASFLLVVRLSGRKLPTQVAATDVLLLGVAAHKLARVVSKDSVTSVIRAPFTEYEEATGAAEVKERPRGRGVQKSLGELLTCPFCIGQWISAVLTYGYVLFPSLTRVVATIFCVTAISDWLQFGYEIVRKASEGEPEESEASAPSGKAA